MLIGSRIRAIRQAQGLTQGEVSERGGLLPAYISRVEHSHTTPHVETLERFARALSVPLYALFNEAAFAKDIDAERPDSTAQEDPFPLRFLRVLGKLDDRHRLLLLDLAHGMAIKRGRPRRARLPKLTR